eukprot:TRINITY_DN884_c0_g1_i1.p1 TRINITY_DN884_c0_g1~~TRINITY_DN884_c0_g1_i1.p1  ORF type:complete len:205 (+),score=36.41 TRINITY_DN884_c0_g1_i1:176-790(+)
MIQNPKSDSYDYLVKLLIIGDSGVGKTCVLLRYCENKFESTHMVTVGIDFKIKTLMVDDKRLKLQIWDTAGQEKFKTITQTFFKGALGIIIAYSCDSRESFKNVENWLRQINTSAGESIVKILIANKCDVPTRAVDYNEGFSLAQKYNMKFFETSAKNNTNIAEAFQAIARDIKEKIVQTDLAQNQNRRLTPGNAPPPKPGCSC